MWRFKLLWKEKYYFSRTFSWVECGEKRAEMPHIESGTRESAPMYWNEAEKYEYVAQWAFSFKTLASRPVSFHFSKFAADYQI